MNTKYNLMASARWSGNEFQMLAATDHAMTKDAMVYWKSRPLSREQR
jgi:hypothetical protein